MSLWNSIREVAAEVVRLRRMIQGIAGPNVRFGADGSIIVNEQPPGPSPLLQGPKILRMKVKDAAPKDPPGSNTNAQDNVLLANVYDGSNTGSDDIAVRTYMDHSQGEEIICVQPQTGVRSNDGTEVTYNNGNVVWEEIEPPPVVRAKLTSFPDQTNDPGILLCTLYRPDGKTLSSGPEVPVLGMEPHCLNDDLLIWRPPGGAMGKEAAYHNNRGTWTNLTQDFIYTVTGKKVVWQEFTSNRTVMMVVPDDSTTSTVYPYKVYWWHVIPVGGGVGGPRDGSMFKTEEKEYNNFGPTASGTWKRFTAQGNEAQKPLIGIWIGEYDSSVTPPRPVFATGFTDALHDNVLGILRPSGASDTWERGNPDGSNSCATFYAYNPATGKKRQVDIDASGRIVRIGAEA